MFDDIRKGVATNRSQFYKDLSAPFFGANRATSTVNQGLRDQFWLQSMQAGLRGAHECVKVFSETDLTEDLKKIDIPLLIVHGDDDQIVSFEDSSSVGQRARIAGWPPWVISGFLRTRGGRMVGSDSRRPAGDVRPEDVDPFAQSFTATFGGARRDPRRLLDDCGWTGADARASREPRRSPAASSSPGSSRRHARS